MARRKHIIVRQQSSGCLLLAMKAWFILTVGVPLAAVALFYLLVRLHA